MAGAVAVHHRRGLAAYGPEVVRRQLGRPIVLSATTAKGASLRSIALSSNGALLAASCSESSNPKINGGDILFWDARTLKPLALGNSNGMDAFNSGNAQRTDNFTFTLGPDAKTVGFYRVLMKNGERQPFALYDISTGKPRWKLTGTHWSFAAHFSPDGHTIGVTRSIKNDMEMNFVRVADGTTIHRWTVPQVWSDTTDFAWAPDGKTIVTVGSSPEPGKESYDEMLKLHYRFEVRRADTGKIVRFWPTRPVSNFDLAPDGRSLVAVTYDEWETSRVNFRAAVIDTATGRERWQFGENKSENRPLAARFAPDGKTIAVRAFYPKDRVILLDAQMGTMKRVLSAGGEIMNSFSNSTALAWAPDGKRLYARGKNAVLVWDLD